MSIRRFFILIFCLSAVACGKRDRETLPTSQLPEAPGRQTLPADGDAAVTLSKNAKAECDSTKPEDCPSGVGFLLSKINSDGRTAIIQCTAFLIDAQTVLTNSHCLDESIRKKDADCSGQIEILFPKTHDAPKDVRARCAKVLNAFQLPKRSQEKLKTPDYAVLRLDSPVEGRKPFEISRDGLPERLKLLSYAFDPMSETEPVGRLMRRECMSIQGSLLVDQATDDFAPVSAVSDCKLVQGNSGSPLIDSSGKVRALIFADSSRDPLSTVAGKKPRDADEFSQVTAVANAACIEIPDTSRFGNRNPKCDEAHRSITEIKIAELGDEAFQNLFLTWTKTADRRFEFKRKRAVEPAVNGQSEFFYEQPDVKCINSPKSWVSEPEKRVRAFEKISMRVPRWALDVEFDKYHRPQFSVKQIADYQFEIGFDIQALERNKKVRAVQTWRPIGPFAGLGERLESEVPICAQ